MSGLGKSQSVGVLLPMFTQNGSIKEENSKIAMGLMVVYIFAFKMVMGSSDWISQGFPPQSNLIGSALCQALSSLLNIIVVLVSPFLICYLRSYSYIGATAIPCLSLGFVWFFVPETAAAKSFDTLKRIWSRHRFLRHCVNPGIELEGIV